MLTGTPLVKSCWGAPLHSVNRPDQSPRRSATIVGWGMSVPAHVRTNADLESMIDTTDAWIVERTGIRERRIAKDGESTFTLALSAAEQSLASAHISGADIDLVIVATLTPHFSVPATANLIQHAIGARKAGALDVNAACAGFVYGMELARALIVAGQYRTVLVIGSDTMSRIVDWTDRSTCVLFGDGAGAVVMQSYEGPGGILSTSLGSDGSGAELLYVPAGGSNKPASQQTITEGLHYIRMNGNEVFKFAVRATAQGAARVIEAAGLQPGDIDLFIPHQANVRIIHAAATALGVPQDSVFVNADRYGNTSAGSIPIALCEALDQERIKPGDHIVLVGFGAGLSWAATAIQWTTRTSDIK